MQAPSSRIQGRGALVDVYRQFAEFYDLYVGDRLDDLALYRGYARRARTRSSRSAPARGG